MQKLNITINTGSFIGQHCSLPISRVSFTVSYLASNTSLILIPSIFHSVYIYLSPCKHFQPFTLSRKPYHLEPNLYSTLNSHLKPLFQVPPQIPLSPRSLSRLHCQKASNKLVCVPTFLQECPVILYRSLLYSYLCISIPSPFWTVNFR